MHQLPTHKFFPPVGTKFDLFEGFRGIGEKAFFVKLAEKIIISMKTVLLEVEKFLFLVYMYACVRVSKTYKKQYHNSCHHIWKCLQN